PRRSVSSPFLLSGLVTCGRCGNRMRTLAVRRGAGCRGGEPKGYYLCRGSSELGLHPGEYIRATQLEEDVLERLRQELAGVAPPRMACAGTRARAGVRSATALAADLQDLAEARFFRREELRKGRMSEAEFQFELAAISRREAELRAELAAMEVPAASIVELPDAACLMRLEAPVAALKRLLLPLLEQVVVWERDRVELHVRFTAAEAAAQKPRSSP
ncbi:MAG: zinc ribbon domain-containing protein, partial [Mycobacterium leprae]